MNQSKNAAMSYMNLAQRTALAYEYQQFERALYGTQHTAPLDVPTVGQAEECDNIIQCYS